MMIPRWSIGTLAITWLATMAWALWTPEPSWYDYYHAYNEHWYSAIVRGEIEGARLPPGYAWIAAVPPLAFLEPVVALRLVSFLAAAALVAVACWTRGARSAALVASLPWVIVWACRAQTDMLAAAFVWSGILLASRTSFLGGLLVGLGSFVKPTSLLGATRLNASFLLGVAIGSIPLGIWLAQSGLANLSFHATNGVPFGNVGNVFGLLLGLGFTVPLLTTARGARHEWVAIGLLLLFALIKAPLVHEYYLLPALVGLALVADTRSPWFWIIIAANATLGLALVTWLSTPAGKNLTVNLLLALVAAASWYYLARRRQKAAAKVQAAQESIA